MRAWTVPAHSASRAGPASRSAGASCSLDERGGPSASGFVSSAHKRCPKHLGFVAVFKQKVLVEGLVIVKVVAAGCGAGVKVHFSVGRALLGNIEMTVKTVIIRHRDSHGGYHFRTMFHMATHAQPRVEEFKLREAARVAEYAFGVGIIGRLKLLGMAVKTGLLGNAFKWDVARLAGKFDLMVSVSCFTGQKSALIVRLEPPDEKCREQ